MERARAMLSDAGQPAHGLPKELWAEAVNTANYIRCRSPAAKKLRTPWELFFGQKPDVSHMRTLGATAYSHIPEEKRQKLDNRSIPSEECRQHRSVGDRQGYKLQGLFAPPPKGAGTM